MKQTEKNKISKEKILNAAIVEFGSKSYENASINNICNENKISKGLIYHYFKNKDDLYLNCVQNCYNHLTAYITQLNIDSKNFEQYMNAYFNSRHDYFRDFPYQSNLFFFSVLQPPKQLVDEINLIRKDFVAATLVHYKKAIKNISFKDNISEKEAIDYFYIFSEMFNSYFQNMINKNSDFNTIIEKHDLMMSKFLKIILYGIAKE